MTCNDIFTKVIAKYVEQVDRLHKSKRVIFLKIATYYTFDDT
jgi:hypothetical protein